MFKPSQKGPSFEQRTSLVTSAVSKRIYLLHHFPDNPITFKDGVYIASDGIPRVMRLITKALVEDSEFEVVVTCRSNQRDLFCGFFTAMLSDQNLIDRIRFLEIDKPVLDSRMIRWFLGMFHEVKGALFERRRVTNPEEVKDSPLPMNYNLMELSELAKLPSSSIYIRTKHRVSLFGYQLCYRVFTTVGPSWWFGLGVILAPVALPTVIIIRLIKQIFDFLRNSRLYVSVFEFFNKKLIFAIQAYSSLVYLSKINSDSRCEWVLVPHYFLFPEAQFIEKKLIMYIPDFTPFFFSVTPSFGDHGYQTLVAKRLTAKAKVVITNSEYTKSYLPLTPLSVPNEKVEVFFSPNLNESKPRSSPSQEISSEILDLKTKINGRKFLIYPTQIRPNKNINLLLEVFEKVRVKFPNLVLVLTGTFDKNAQCQRTFSDLNLSPHIIFALGISDETLSWLYSAAECLVLTSQMEGNFPPQILEALALKCPVVASRIPLIEEVARDVGDYLLLADPASHEEFINLIQYVFKNREIVLERQEKLQVQLQTRNSWNQFSSGLLKALQARGKA